LFKPTTRIIKIKGNWNEVLNDCRFTVGKCDLDKEPSERFKKQAIISEHSPIRNIIFKWEWLNIPHFSVVHWVRHKWEKYVRTDRSDRTGIDRHTLPQDHESSMRGEANTQHLIDTMRKRLCFQASMETREEANSLKCEISKVDKIIADGLVPNCIYRCGCPEDSKCRFFQDFASRLTVEELLDIQARYDKYNKQFYEVNKFYLTQTN
jgi:hypothetical protein